MKTYLLSLIILTPLSGHAADDFQKTCWSTTADASSNDRFGLFYTETGAITHPKHTNAVVQIYTPRGAIRIGPVTWFASTVTTPIAFTIKNSRMTHAYCRGETCEIPAGVPLPLDVDLGYVRMDTATTIPFTLHYPGYCTGIVTLSNPAVCSTTVSQTSIAVKMAPNATLDRPFTITTTCNRALSQLTMDVTGFTNAALPATLTLTSPGANSSVPGSFLMTCNNSDTCSKTVNVNIKSGTPVGHGRATLFIDTYSG